MLGATLDNEVFTDLGFGDDVASIAETTEPVLLPLKVMQQEVRPLGLEINKPKTKIQETGIEPDNNNILSKVSQNVEIVDSFVYLGCTIHQTGSGVPEFT